MKESDTSYVTSVSDSTEANQRIVCLELRLSTFISPVLIFLETEWKNTFAGNAETQP